MALFLLFALMFVSVEMKSVETESARSETKRESTCYGNLGCFSTDAPFTSPERPVAVAPEDPDKIKTQFLLYTREGKTSDQILDARHPETVKSVWSLFKKRQTQILIHGFMDSPTLTSLWGGLKNELLKHGDYNVIIVDWSSGNLFPYDQACANARVVGAQIAEMIKACIDYANVTAADFHIIGHSLGAHVCGYAGERIPGLGRITGLDPAGPYFDNTDKIVRLDETDAVFVDAIHTDAKNLLQLGLGAKIPSGHADFFPNSGHDQPGCTRDPLIDIINNGVIEGIEQILACDHVRAVNYFTESVNTQCPFMGFPCASEDDYKNNLCHSCTADGCAPMGFNADTKKLPEGKRVKYYLSTAPHAPYCKYHLSVTLKLAYGMGEDEKGTIDLTINGENSQSTTVTLTGDSSSDALTFSPGHTYKFYVLEPSDFGSIQSVTFTWKLVTSILDPLHWDILGLRHPKLYIDEIDVIRDEAGVDVHLCSQNHQSVESGTTLTVSTKC